MVTLRTSLSRHRSLVALVVAVYATGAAFIASGVTVGAGVPSLSRFMTLSMTAMLFDYLIGGVCLWQGVRRGLSWCVGWGVAFVALSLVGVGLILEGLGMVSMAEPLWFVVFRQGIVLWAVGLVYGTVRLFTRDRELLYGLTTATGVGGYALLLYALTVHGATVFTMQLFLTFFFAPVAIVLAYMFWWYADSIKGPGMKWAAVGMGVIGASYLVWAPIYRTPLFVLGFHAFIVGQALFLVGLTHLPFPVLEDVDTPLSTPV